METPCIHICALDPDGLCSGCYRTIDEIVGWSSFTEQERRRIMTELETRKSVGEQTTETANA